MSTVFVGIDHANGPDQAVFTVVDQTMRRLMCWRVEHHNNAEGLKHLCTGIGASWCPVHGDCLCLFDDELGIRDHDACPLHARWSGHGEETYFMAYPKSKEQEQVFLFRRRSFQAARVLRDRLLELWSEGEVELRADLTPGILGFRRLVVLLRMFGSAELVSELAREAWPMAWEVAQLSVLHSTAIRAKRAQFEDDLLFLISQSAQPSAGELFRLRDPDWESKKLARRGRKGGAKFANPESTWRRELLEALGWTRQHGEQDPVPGRWKPPFHPLNPLSKSSRPMLPEPPWWSPTVPRRTEQEWSYAEQDEVQGRGYYVELVRPYTLVHNLPKERS